MTTENDKLREEVISKYKPLESFNRFKENKEILMIMPETLEKMIDLAITKAREDLLDEIERCMVMTFGMKDREKRLKTFIDKLRSTKAKEGKT